MQQNEAYQKAFIFHHSTLIRKLSGVELIEIAFSKQLIGVGEFEEINSLKTDSSKISKLLSKIHRRYYGNPNVFKELLTVIEEVSDNENGILDHVINGLCETIKNPPDFPSSSSLMGEFERARLQLNEATIIATLDVDMLLPDLISEGVVNMMEAESIENENTFEKKGAKLVDLIKMKGSEVFQRFIDVLRDSETYERLADRLSRPEEDIDGGSDLDDKIYVERVLKDGHVPPVPHNSVRRVELIKSIRRELRKMRDTDSWVVIHGLPGFGKTVLAADSVSQASLLREVFPGGVFWLSIGKLRDSSGDVNMDALLEKIQNFILRMDKDKYRPLNLESATDYLQTVMSNQHPRSLLILDDVWEPESAQAFSVRCRTLVTTRNLDIAEGVATNNVYKVSVTEGLTQDEGLMLLSKYTGVPVTDLPLQASEIIKLSYGSPIVLDIIGASLPKSSGRWKVAVDRLKTQHPGGLKAGTSPYLRTRRPSEQKRGTKATLNTSILMTEESLSEESREYFQWLIVFREDTVIRPDTLATIWDMNKYDAVDIIEELRTWSLVKHAHIQSDEDDDNLPSYTIHDMIMDYLRERVSEGTQREYHSQLVERYHEKCHGVFSSLEPDGYIHKNLLSHIDRAGDVEGSQLIASLLTDLRWLAACVRYWDCNSLLAAYKKYKTKLTDKDVLSVVNEFQLFLSGNLDVLSTNPSLSDVVQLALTTLHSDSLVKQARRETEKDNDTMYLIWNNRLSAKRPESTLKLQPHANDVRHCQYYDNGSKVVSCSNDVVKLWMAATGEVLESFSKHTNTITHCTITEDGSLLVDSSDDSTCNVWDVTQHSLMLKFEEHFDGVQCCELSPDNKLVVSVDINSYALVWSCDRSNLGTVIGKWTHGDCGLTSCTFLKSGKEVVVANQDGLITKYSIHGDPLISFPLNPSVLTFSQSGVVELASSRGPSRSSSSSTGGSGFTVNSCVVNADGTMLAAGAADCTARVWSTDTSVQLHSFPHSSQVLSVDFSPDSKLLLTGCVSGIIQVWSLANQCPILDLPIHYDWVMCTKFSPTGSQILTSSSLGIVKVTPLETGKQNWKLYKRRFSAQFNMNVDRSYTPTIVCYDTKSKSLEVCEGLNASPTAVIDSKKKLKPRSWSISPDSTLVAVGYDEGSLQLFDVNGTLQWKQDDAHNGEIPHCYFSPDGSKIVSCGDCHQVWSVESGDKLSWQPDCQEFYIQPCVFYNDSKRLASAKKPGKILVWKTTDQDELFYCDNDEEVSILCVNINRENTRLVASTGEGSVIVWDAESGHKLFTGSYSGSSDNHQARFCSLDRHGVLAAVGHDDCTLKIYNIESGEEITCPNSFSGSWMISTQFSPDDQRIVTLSNSIQWWSRDGQLLKHFILKSIFGKFLYFSPDFKTFITIDNTGLLYVLSVL